MVIKGAKKQMIVLRTGESRYFDEAYFVLRKDVSEAVVRGEDMLGEANRILKESTAHHRNAPLSRKARWCFFFVGCICGAICAALTICLIVF